MLSDNMILNNWLNGMKANNINLYENIRNNHSPTSNQIQEVNNLQENNQSNNDTRQPTQMNQQQKEHYLNMAMNQFGSTNQGN